MSNLDSLLEFRRELSVAGENQHIVSITFPSECKGVDEVIRKAESLGLRKRDGDFDKVVSGVVVKHFRYFGIFECKPENWESVWKATDAVTRKAWGYKPAIIDAQALLRKKFLSECGFSSPSSDKKYQAFLVKILDSGMPQEEAEKLARDLAS